MINVDVKSGIMKNMQQNVCFFHVMCCWVISLSCYVPVSYHVIPCHTISCRSSILLLARRPDPSSLHSLPSTSTSTSTASPSSSSTPNENDAHASRIMSLLAQRKKDREKQRRLEEFQEYEKKQKHQEKFGDQPISKRERSRSPRRQ